MGQLIALARGRVTGARRTQTAPEANTQSAYTIPMVTPSWYRSNEYPAKIDRISSVRATPRAKSIIIAIARIRMSLGLAVILAVVRRPLRVRKKESNATRQTRLNSIF